VRRLAVLVVAIALAVTVVPGTGPARAGIIDKGCGLLGTIGEGWWGKACRGVGDVLGVTSKIGGKANQAAGALGKLGSNPALQRAASLAAIVAWVLGGARWTMNHVATAISQTTSPHLSAAWFTRVYLKTEAIAWLLTIPFLVAAAIQAVLRSELALLAKAAFTYLPLAALVTGLAVPVTMLLLSGTDALSAGLARMAGQDGTHFLTGTSAWVTAGLSVVDPFVAVIAAIIMVLAGFALWTEMVVRELAVYVVVLMLPLVFCAMVWPARRVWAQRTVEVLIALILAKFAIIVPLALGAAALAHGGAGSGVGRLAAGLALVGIGCLAPWLLMRLIPLAEVASATVGHIRGQLHAHTGIPTPEVTAAAKVAQRIRGGNGSGPEDVRELLQNMIRRAEQTEQTAAPSSGQPAAGQTEPDPAPTTDGTATSTRGTADLATQAAPEGAPVGAAGAGSPGGRPAAATGPTHVEEGGASSASAAPHSTEQQDEPQTMVQNADGSWEPLRTGDPNAPIPPPPWEEAQPPADEQAAGTPPADPLALASPDGDPQDSGEDSGDAGDADRS
jgi:hypothetical protein